MNAIFIALCVNTIQPFKRSMMLALVPSHEALLFSLYLGPFANNFLNLLFFMIRKSPVNICW